MTTQPDLSKPSLAALSHVLRHPEIWPEGFEWDYRLPSCCGLGLSHRLWSVCRSKSITNDLADALSIPVAVVNRIFCDATVAVGKERASQVTPADVATLIDAYLAKQASERADRGVAKIIDTALHSPTSEPPPVYTVERVW